MSRRCGRANGQRPRRSVCTDEGFVDTDGHSVRAAISIVRIVFIFVAAVREKKHFTLVFLLTVFLFIGFSSQIKITRAQESKSWAQSVLDTLTLEEKIGQLFMVAAYSNKGSEHVTQIENLIREYNIGGLIFFQGGPLRQANLTNHYQSLTKIPLLIGQDFEWGLAMRLDSTLRFPKNMTLGAIQNDSLIYEMGKEIGRECNELGVHINFAPVIDINNNPKNPVIGERSFGENKFRVAEKGIAVMSGLQSMNVLACGKHFPGHGDTDADSHYELPLINHSQEKIDTLDTYPFRALIQAGLKSIMVAHLYIPALDSTKNLASTLSPKIVNDYLKEQLKFDGLVFTDALNMQAVIKYPPDRRAGFPPGEIELQALLAGNDVLLFSLNVPLAIEMIKSAVQQNKISEAEINARVLKILKAKEWAGLNNYQSVVTEGLYERLNTTQAKILIEKLYENAVTVAENNDDILPLGNLSHVSIACVIAGENANSEFAKTCAVYAPLKIFSIPKNPSDSTADVLLRKISDCNTVIFSLSPEKNQSVSQNIIRIIRLCKAENKKIILVVFGNPYSLKNFLDYDVLICSYENNSFTQRMTAEIIFGGLTASGTLPVTADTTFTEGKGFALDKIIRLGFDFPEAVGLLSDTLNNIDSIAIHAIHDTVFPGCQILVAKDNKIIYNKAFGNLTYETANPVTTDSTIYDVASVTKVAATTLSAMKLVSEGKLKTNNRIGFYLPEYLSTDKEFIQVRNLLQHNAGFPATIFFYSKTIDKETWKLKPGYYSRTRTDSFNIPVAENIFLIHSYPDTMWKYILKVRIPERKRVVYSDLSMVLMGRIIEKITEKKLDEYADSVFYKPMGLSHSLFNPKLHHTTFEIAPTENDTLWRKQLVQGYVHDPTAAMLGGVSGNAGLFSNAMDLAALMQMMLNGGEYAGIKFFPEDTMKKFLSRHVEENRRGWGWDMAEPDTTKTLPTAKSASLQTFGHMGFTGTSVWADPENQIIFIFLSNRVHPNVENKKISEYNIRTNMMQAIYNAINGK